MPPSFVGTGAAVVLFADSARRARTHTVRPSEERVFRRFNRVSDSLQVPVWAVMQSGSLAAVFVVGGTLARSGRTRPAVTAATAGTAVWGGVKLIKPLIGRSRPADLLDDVDVRGHAQSGLGFPSGHAAVAATLAAIVAPTAAAQHLAAVTAGLVVGSTRMYVGAHLPLDVIGGVAIGMLGGYVARVIVGRAP